MFGFGNKKAAAGKRFLIDGVTVIPEIERILKQSDRAILEQMLSNNNFDDGVTSYIIIDMRMKRDMEAKGVA